MEQNKNQSHAAVRGEAVAVHTGWKLVPVEATWEMTRPAFSFDVWRVRCDCGQEHSGGLSHNKAAQLFKSMADAAPVSAGAADAPSDPSERAKALEEFYQASVVWEGVCGHPEATLNDERRAEERFIAAGKAMRELPVKSRAADALDSQPTEPDGLPPLPEPIEVGGEGWDFDDFKSEKTFSCEHMWAYARAAIASSQPTDGGVRNAAFDEALAVTKEQIKFFAEHGRHELASAAEQVFARIQRTKASPSSEGIEAGNG